MNHIESRLSPISRRLMLAFLASLVSMAVPAANGSKSERPLLVVGIVIDGLDPDYVELLRDHFGPDGFNKLINNSVVLANTHFGTNLDATAATAMLVTGSAPSTTSIGSGVTFDVNAQRVRPVLHDPSAMGNFTDQTFSPRSLAVSTLSDEVRIAGNGVTQAYSVAPDPRQAVLLAGHNANAALWLNEKTGNWATSTFYKDPPTTLTRHNRFNPLMARLDTMAWSPVREPAAYPGLPEHLTHYSFKYVFPKGDRDRVARFATSPLINTEVTDIAGMLIADMELGKHDGTDMLSLAYSLKPYEFSKNAETRFELMDSYLRLDRDLARLFNTVTQKVGADKAVFVVAATPPSGIVLRDEERWEIPYGEFSTRKAISLLNMYLMALHGNGEWVSGFHGGQFFLNHKLIKEHGLKDRDVRTESADFLMRMSGVDRVYTIDDVVAGRAGENGHARSRNTALEGAGDLFIDIMPGWELVDDYVVPADKNRVHHVYRAAVPASPVYIMAPGVDARTIDTPVDARQIAPTVARVLRIRSPNAATLPAISL